MLIDKYLPADYSDCYSKTIDARSQITVDALFDSMFCNFPWPVRMLLRFRDAMVKPFGLKTGTTFRDRIIERNDEEIVIGTIDKHLNFWVSVYCSLPEKAHQKASITTIVTFHNLPGRIYFTLILLFHKATVGFLFRRVVCNIARSSALIESDLLQHQ